jgi:hypothetical protein
MGNIDLAIYLKHYRGVAQPVGRQSPKPGVVDSSPDTPAMLL